MAARPRLRAAAALAAALALLAAAALLARPAAAHAGGHGHGGHGGGVKPKPKGKPKAKGGAGAPPTMNPYADAPYAGCDGGFCASENFASEAALFKAAEAGDVPALKAALGDKRLNTTRNIVPDGDGFVRVIDVAVWMAAKHGRLGVMEVRAAGGGGGEAAGAGRRWGSGALSLAGSSRRVSQKRAGACPTPPVPRAPRAPPTPPPPPAPRRCWTAATTATSRRATWWTWQVGILRVGAQEKRGSGAGAPTPAPSPSGSTRPRANTARPP
jgi:hypothetical protein